MSCLDAIPVLYVGLQISVVSVFVVSAVSEIQLAFVMHLLLEALDRLGGSHAWRVTVKRSLQLEVNS